MSRIVAALLTGLLVLATAWSIEDARWVLGRHELTGYLGGLGLLAVGLGATAGGLGWPRRVAYPLGALLGALVVPVVVGSVIAPGESPLGGFVATAKATTEAYLDLAWRGKALTDQVGHYMLTLGLLVWATGLFAGYATLGRRRPLDAIFVPGFVLLMNMSLTSLDQLRLLVLFSSAALLLLVRGHASDEIAHWLERRMGAPDDVGSLYLRGGVAFSSAAIAGALLLTATASSAPLANAWTGVAQDLRDLAAGLERYLPRGGPGSRLAGISFGPSATITGQWVTDESEALGIALPADDRRTYYWRAVAYDRFDLAGWSISATTTRTYDPGSPLIGASAEVIGDASAMTRLRYEVRPAGYRGREVFIAGVPASVGAGTRFTLLGGDQLAILERDGDAAAPYAVETLAWKTGDADGGLTENRLRAAGTDYPTSVRALYLAVPDGAVGPNASALLDAIRARAPGATPYDLAKTAAQYLRSSAFTYDTNVVDIGCADPSVVECFATFRTGYCQHYASTMTILLRAAGIPARFVEGFLPGARDAAGLETIRTSGSHAWVEVYFPGYGWIAFDPTGGGVAQLAPLPAGDPAASPRPSATSGDGTDRSAVASRRPELDDGAGGATSGGALDPRGPLTAVAILLALLMAAAAFAAYRRGPAGPSAPELVFGRVSAIAARLGFARRPSESIYEYAGSLGDALPSARPELHAVAHATVEVAYGRRALEEARLASLAVAERRLRVALLRLLVRRRRGARRDR